VNLTSDDDGEESHQGLLASKQFEAVLDIGAGDGNVTTVMAPYFRSIYTTEMSRFMHSRLQKKGYKVLDAIEWHQTGPIATFKLVSLLNVLDR